MNIENPTGPKVAAVIVAAGRGERAGQAGGPKQYRAVGGVAIIARTVRLFLDHPAIGTVIVAIHADDQQLFRDALGDDASRVKTVIGNSTRQGSVLNALKALADVGPDIVLIHDGVRPFATSDLIDRVIAVTDNSHGAIPALAAVETLKRGKEGLVDATIPRGDVFAAQTPQAFPFQPIVDAHMAAATGSQAQFTDDASIAEWAGLKVRLVAGEPDNIKLTYARDIEMAENSLARNWPDVRTGNGYDVHVLEPGDGVTLCGVFIPHDQRLSGHSDADVALHALTDALLATCGAGDIGVHFPPSDQQWKGAASSIFVEHAVRTVTTKGGRIANVDITLICEAPRIGPHRDAMVAALQKMLSIGSERISVKATTNEGVGFVGRKEGIAAIATATVLYPGSV